MKIIKYMMKNIVSNFKRDFRGRYGLGTCGA
jgi:hypothetical protein